MQRKTSLRKSISFLLAFLYFTASTHCSLCLCLSAWISHIISGDVCFLFASESLPCNHISEQKQACSEKTWCMPTPSALTLTASIMQGHWFFKKGVWLYTLTWQTPHPEQHAGAYIFYHVPSVYWDIVSSEYLSRGETFLSMFSSSY